ncbi:myosin regulatory light chain 2 [Homalodisca vitripennis]|uniref:myosin regulatory light chain 2 n=1 Tax=Homalodisca vitripennis TaxID=197043 RepID=UPI001EEC2019|nr:myosin regulatory light chain 2 [Homalodisca vitripennis]KAG8330603.1 calcium ion binding [Homalodisca vitripennis]
MADKEKKKKKKKEEAPAPAPEPEPAPPPEPEPAPSKASTKASSRGSKKSAKRSGSNVFSMFSQGQIAEFKEGFAFMDADKDGIIGKSDLRSTFNQIGKLVSEKELDEMVNEAPGPINFTQLLTLFANRMSGQADEDDVVIAAFKTFDNEGVIDGEKLRHALMTWGEKFSAKECDDAYENFVIDDKGMIDTEALIELLCGASKDEEEEA